MDYLATLNDRQLQEYIAELDEKLDSDFGSSTNARDRVNAAKELKRRQLSKKK